MRKLKSILTGASYAISFVLFCMAVGLAFMLYFLFKTAGILALLLALSFVGLASASAASAAIMAALYAVFAMSWVMTIYVGYKTVRFFIRKDLYGFVAYLEAFTKRKSE